MNKTDWTYIKKEETASKDAKYGQQYRIKKTHTNTLIVEVV